MVAISVLTPAVFTGLLALLAAHATASAVGKAHPQGLMRSVRVRAQASPQDVQVGAPASAASTERITTKSVASLGQEAVDMSGSRLSSGAAIGEFGVETVQTLRSGEPVATPSLLQTASLAGRNKKWSDEDEDEEEEDASHHATEEEGSGAEPGEEEEQENQDEDEDSVDSHENKHEGTMKEFAPFMGAPSRAREDLDSAEKAAKKAIEDLNTAFGDLNTELKTSAEVARHAEKLNKDYAKKYVQVKDEVAKVRGLQSHMRDDLKREHQELGERISHGVEETLNNFEQMQLD